MDILQTFVKYLAVRGGDTHNYSLFMSITDDWSPLVLHLYQLNTTHAVILYKYSQAIDRSLTGLSVMLTDKQGVAEKSSRLINCVISIVTRVF